MHPRFGRLTGTLRGNARALTAVVLAALSLSGCYLSSRRDHDSSSGSRLRRNLLGPPGGPAMFVGLHDSELDTDCYGGVAEDGVLRCLPGWHRATVLFFDSACASPGVAPPPCGEVGFISGALSRDACGTPSSRIRVYEPLGAATSVDAAYRIDSTGACVEYAHPPDALVPLAPMDPSRFVALTRVRDESGDSPIAVDRLVAEDGASMPYAWRDRAHDWDCAGMPWVENEPTPCVLADGYRFLRSSSTCDHGWAVVPSGCDAPPYAVSDDSSLCEPNSTFHVWSVGDPVSDAERAAMCSFVSSSDTAYQVSAADDEVPWISSEWTGTGRLQIATMVDSSGRELTRFAYQYFDTELDVPCFPASTTAGLRCVPGSVSGDIERAPSVGLVFADAACSVPAGLPHYRECVPTNFAYSFSTTECGSTMDGAYRVGAALDTTYELDDSGACVVADPTSYQGYALTPVPLDSLARLRSFTE